MILSGTHTTAYTYDAPVTLDMHAVRLQPRTGGGQLLRRFDIEVSPTPVAQTQTVDAEGNALHFFWFIGPTTHLTVKTRFAVENRRANPFDFIPSPMATLPPQLPPEERELLRPCLKTSASPDIAQLAQTLAAEGDGSALGFVTAANGWISANIRAAPRKHGVPLAPETTLTDRRGACRDQTVLLMALCRDRGIPARFVSGYLLPTGSNGDPHELHAWAEAWIPGGGWRAFDPTLGLAVADRHIAVAASYAYSLAAPVSGSYRGNVVSRPPDHVVSISSDGV